MPSAAISRTWSGARVTRVSTSKPSAPSSRRPTRGCTEEIAVEWVKPTGLITHRYAIWWVSPTRLFVESPRDPLRYVARAEDSGTSQAARADVGDSRPGGSAASGRRARGHRAQHARGARRPASGSRCCSTRTRRCSSWASGPVTRCTRSGAGRPAAGVLTVIGSVHGRRVMVVANDATVKAGACFPLTIKKILRAQAIAAPEPVAAGLPRRLIRRFPADAGRGLSRRRRLRPDLSQQRRPLGAGAFLSMPRSWAIASPAVPICRYSATRC